MMKIGNNHATAAVRRGRLPPAPAKPKAKHFGPGSCCLRPITPRPLTDLKKSREATLECSQTRQCLVAVECNSRPSGTADLPSHSLGQKSNNRRKPGRSSNTVSLGWRPPVATTSPAAPSRTRPATLRLWTAAVAKPSRCAPPCQAPQSQRRLVIPFIIMLAGRASALSYLKLF